MKMAICRAFATKSLQNLSVKVFFIILSICLLSYSVVYFHGTMIRISRTAQMARTGCSYNFRMCIRCFLLIPGRYLLCLMSVLVLCRSMLRAKSTRMLRIWASLSLPSHIAHLCGMTLESLYILLTT